MTQGERSGVGWWAGAPLDRVVRLEGVAPDLLRLSLDPLPPGAPAVLGCGPAAPNPAGPDRSGPDPSRPGPPAWEIEALLDELERAALALFPHWLPGAALIPGPQGSGVPAVRALARAAAATSAHFGPFLADLAERALRREPPDAGGFAPAVRAAGLARVVAAGYGRPSAALLIDVPEGLSAAQEHSLVSSAEWIAGHGGWGVWLTGSPLRSVDRIDSHRIRLPEELADVAAEAARTGERPPSPPTRPTVPPAPPSAPPPSFAFPPAPSNSGDSVGAFVHCPALAGFPRADSPAELKLESALRTHEWAVGRAWNATYQPDPLAPTYRLDLWWAAEHCVVEVDGPEHHNAVHYAADRLRDVRLQLAGNAVLRFTNDQVLTDVRTVVSQIHRLIRSRRPEVLEDQTHAR